ncbi:PIN domain-containing protein [Streptomyces sp. NBC_01262]|uniref:PIN domain-containing protein n=1 Tax=Streptomyces sp. NBC_01262 TaxID=2903803 RepID=UPI002E339139|nr:PIN domain-containing protein [Streptomyces sp. NBC_01262]
MAFIAVYDANVLYPSTLRDVLIRVAQAGLVQAKWTDQILDETFRNLKENRPDLDPQKLDQTREKMSGAIRDVLVKGYEPLIDIIDLPDPNDRHVLAAAIRAKAQVIVTFNLKDFPADKLAPWDVQVLHPDAFVEAQVDLSPRLVYAELQRIADSWRYPPNAVVGDVIASLERDGLVAAAAALRALT